MSDESRRIAWSALETGTPIVASDGREIGRVTSVVADEEKDIFSGVAFRHGMLDTQRFLPADLINEMTPERVTVRVASTDVEDLETFET